MLPKALVDDEGGEDKAGDDDCRPEELLAQIPPAHQIGKAVDGRLVAVVLASVE